MKSFYSLLQALFVAAAFVCVSFLFAYGSSQQAANGGATAVPRMSDGHPDLNGVLLYGVVPDIDHYGVSEQPNFRIPATFDPNVTPQEPPSFQRWVKEKIKALGDTKGIDPEVTCEPRGAAKFFLGPGYPLAIVQTPQQVVVLNELTTNWRIIYTDGRSHDRNPEPQFGGDAVGHWEGDTLVVDVIGLDSHTWLPTMGAGGGPWIPSDQTHMTERFSRTDPKTLVYQVTIEDPKVLTKPWVSVPRKYTYAPGKRFYEYYCTNNSDLQTFNPESKFPTNAYGNDARFFDEQEYQAMRAKYPD